MRKFIGSMFIIILGMIGLFYLIYFKGFYINPFTNDSLQILSKVENKSIMVKENDTFKEISIKGVNLPSSISNHRSTDFAIDKETYLRWFKLIQEMGANTLRIYTIYDSTFYDALYEFNNDNPNPLYLLQGIRVTDYANNSKNDAYSKGFYYSLREDARDVVDVVHGKKIISNNKTKGSGIYTKDVSPWLLGYMIGSDWNPDTIAYTNNRNYSSAYEGKYFRTTQEASPFEALLADIMDKLVTYETNKYHCQSLVTFSSSTTTDPFEYEIEFSRAADKYVSLDPNHIEATENLKSGYFASYQLAQVYTGFEEYFSAEQKEKLSPLLTELTGATEEEKYFKLLSNYHTMPVVISEFGFSTSRGTDEVSGNLNEQQQGEALINMYQNIIEGGCQGAIINSWQDSWEKVSWNTSYAVEVDKTYRWHDIQSKNTGYGILGFKSNDIEIDGDDSDWPKKHTIINDGETLAYTFYDEKGLYLFIKNNALTMDKELYLALDITPNSGSKTYLDKVQFDRAADFIIRLSKTQGEILVHSRYESLRENYLAQITGEDPFIRYPEQDDEEFVPISMICKSDIFDNIASNNEVVRHSVFETGKLIQGHSKDNSLADYCYSLEGVELRIPWQLLNVSNPTEFKIHDDYYMNYGVESISVDTIYMGVFTEEKNDVSMNQIELKDYKVNHFDEYLKDSYEMIQSYWRK